MRESPAWPLWRLILPAPPERAGSWGLPDTDDPEAMEAALLRLPDDRWRAYLAAQQQAWEIDAEGAVVTDDPWLAAQEQALKEAWRG